MTIKKGIICEDENLQNKIYPYTQMDCVFDSDNSTTLDVVVDDIKENLMYVDEIGAYENVVPINADQLEGHDAAYFEDLIDQIDYVQVNGLAIHKNNKIVAIYVTSNYLEGDGMTMGTIPVGYRPVRESMFYSKCWNGSSYVDCRIRIQTSGVVTLTTPGDSAISGIQPSFIQLKPIMYMITA